MKYSPSCTPSSLCASLLRSQLQYSPVCTAGTYLPVVSRGSWRPNHPFCFPNVHYNLNHLHLGPPSSPMRFCRRVFLLRSPEPIVTLDWTYFWSRRIVCIPVLILSSKKPWFNGLACCTLGDLIVSACKWKSIPENHSVSRMLQLVRYVKLLAALPIVFSGYASVSWFRVITAWRWCAESLLG